MIMKANKQIGFIYKNNESIDKILKDGDVVFERGFLREKTSTTLPITFGGVGKDLKDYKIYGNTYQNSTSGKNLCGVPNLNTTISGVEINIEDGIITLNGTATGAIFYYINPINTTILNGGYTLNNIYVSGDVSSTGTKNFNIRRADDKSNIFSNGFVQSNSYRYNNFSENVEIIFGIYCTSGTAFNNYKFMPQLVAGIEPDYDYESYTGGKASPNPDYPQEMISCGDKTKNLIGFDDLTETTSNGVTYSIKDNVFTLNGTATDNIRYLMTDNWLLKNAGNHTLKIDVISGTWTAGIIGFSLRKADLTQETYHQLAYNTSNLTITKEYTEQNINNTVRIGFFINKNSVFSNFKFRIIFNEGSTATSYEPYYEGYKIPVNVRSDNLFDKDNFTNGYIDSSGVYHADSGIKANALSDYIKIDNNTDYIFSAKSSIYNLSFALYDSNKTFIKRVNAYNADSNKINSGTSSYCRVSCNISQRTNITSELIEQYEIQLIKSSSKPSKYIPYYNETTNIYLDEPLRKIDEYSDYIDFINGKVVRNIEEIVLNGSESGWTKSGNNANTSYYYNGLPASSSYKFGDIKLSLVPSPSSSSAVPIYSDRFKAVKNNEFFTDIIGIRMDYPSPSNAIEFRVGFGLSTDITTTELLKTWLSSHNVTVDYVLETPTEEDIELPSIPTVEGNNTLNIETEITPSQVYIKYKSNS